MSIENDLIIMSLKVILQEADKEEIDFITRDFMSELQNLNIESAELITEKSRPQNTKGVDPVLIGAIAVATLPSFVPALVQFIQNWTMRGEGRSIKIKVQVDKRSIEVEYNPTITSPEELTKLINTITGKLSKG